MNLVDPEGEWIQESKGNLVAESGDNAWTFATFLNVSIEISKALLEDQGFSVNEKDVLQLKEGDVFIVDTIVDDSSKRMHLSGIGDIIRDKVSSGIGKDLFENYWNAGGDYSLSSSQMVGILLALKSMSPHYSTNCTLIGESGNEYDGNALTYSFYHSRQYALALGTATVLTNNHGQVVGFDDDYDFNRGHGTRSLKNEVRTRLVYYASPKRAKPFKIKYGYTKK